MNDQSAYLSITRFKSISNIMRGYTVCVDDKIIDKVGSGDTRKYALPPGPHTVHISLDHYRSDALRVELRAGQTVALECGDATSDALSKPLSLGSVGNSLKAMVTSAGYLFLRPAGATPSQIGPVQAPVAEPGPQSGRPRPGKTIFVSYRREDSRAITGRISDRLNSHFGNESIFRDVDSIPIGVDFRERIRDTIDKSDVLIAIIGPAWIGLRNEDNQRRLDLEDDFVRLEIEEALQKDIAVVPVLVDGAQMPGPDELPDVLAPLAFRNALFIPREPFFHAGVDKLVEQIEQLGQDLPDAPPPSRFCTGCGNTLSGKKFCTHCGKAAPSAP